MVQHVPCRQEDDSHDPDRGRDTQRATDTEPAKQIGVIGKTGINRAAVGVHHGHTAQQQHHHQRGDECLNATFRHNHAGYGANCRTCRQGSGNGHQRVDLNTNNRRGDRAGEGQQGTDGQIDTRGQNHQRHPHRHNGVDGGLLKNVEQVIDGKKVGAHGRDNRDQHQQGNQRFLFHQPCLCEIAATRNSLGSHLLTPDSRD